MEHARNTISPKKPLLNGTLKLFIGSMVLANISGNMYGPLLPLYLQSLNASVVDIGLFFTISQMIPLVLQVIGGWLSDRLGRLRSIAWGSVIGVISYIPMILAPSWEWVLIGEALSAMTRALVGPSFGAFIAEQSDESSRARVYAVSEMLFTIVTVVGPPLGGWLAGTYGFRLMMLAAGILYTFATIIRIGMAKKAVSNEKSKSSGLAWKGFKKDFTLMFAMIIGGGLVTWMILTDGIRDITGTMAYTLMPLYLENIGGLTVQQIGLLSSFMGIATMLTNIPGGWIADKSGERVSIILGFLFQFFGAMLFLKADTFLSFAGSFSLFGAGFGLMGPAYNALISKAIPDEIRGTAFGLLQTSLGIFSLPAPAIGAELWERISPRFPFILLAWASIITVIPIWFKFKLPEKEENPKSDT